MGGSRADSRARGRPPTGARRPRASIAPALALLPLAAAALLAPPDLSAQQRSSEIGDFDYVRQVTATADRSFIRTIDRGPSVGLLWQCEGEDLRVELSSRGRFRGRSVRLAYRLPGDTAERSASWVPSPSGPPRAPPGTVARLTRDGSGADSLFLRVRAADDSASARLGLGGFDAALSRLPCGR